MNKEYMDDLVSVIIPVYNSSGYVSKTIGTVLYQTYQNLELLVIDDCSTDDTAKVIKKIQAEDNRVRYIKLEKNSGASVARNKGILEAKGRYIAFLDSDDLWEKSKITIQINFMKKNSAYFSFTAYDLIDENYNLIKKKRKIKKTVTYNSQLRKTIISTPTVMIDSKKFKDKYMPIRRTGQDYAFWLLLLREEKAYGIDEVLVHVQKRKNSLSKNKFQSIKDVWEVQTINEEIPKILVFFNVTLYIINTLLKKLK